MTDKGQGGRWVSRQKVWENCAVFGVGVGWDAGDGSACLLLQFGRWLVVIGPPRPTPEPPITPPIK